MLDSYGHVKSWIELLDAEECDARDDDSSTVADYTKEKQADEYQPAC